MRVKWHYYCSFSNELKESLDTLCIKSETIQLFHDGEISVPAILVFDVFEDTPVWEELLKVTPPTAQAIPQICFSDKEMSEAEWLAVRGTSMKLEIADECFYMTELINDHQAYHRYRTDQPLKLQKMVKWSSRQFFYCAYELGYENLFCNDAAKSVLNKCGCDVQFEPVFNAKTGTQIPNISFMNIARVVSTSDISWNRGATEIICPICGKMKIDYGGDFQLYIANSALKKAGNLCRTEAIFGGGNFQKPITVVSQELYQTFKRQSMTRNLTFTPIAVF